jgi:hypothetical protein
MRYKEVTRGQRRSATSHSTHRAHLTDGGFLLTRSRPSGRQILEELPRLAFLVMAQKLERRLMRHHPAYNQAGARACLCRLLRLALRQVARDHRVLDLAMTRTVRQATLQLHQRADQERPH